MRTKIKIFSMVLFIIQIVSISKLNSQTYFSDNFETGLSKWIIAGSNNWDTLFTTYCSPGHCITDSRISNYIYNTDPIITMSGNLNLTNSTTPVLTFFHKYNLYEDWYYGYDSIHVEISTNGGFNWTKIQGWRQTNNAWTYEQINLSAYKSNNFKLRFHLSSHNGGGGSADGWYIDDVNLFDMNSSVKKLEGNIPSEFSLFQNYPNPFNPRTNINFAIPKNEFVTIKIFDILGKEVETLVNENLSPGTYSVDWNAYSHPSGIYFYRLQTESYVETKKMNLIK